MEILDVARTLLEEAEYCTRLRPINRPELRFEDRNVYGFLSIMDDVQAILDTWEKTQDAFIKEHTAELNRVPDKAWNLYVVFLTAEACSNEQHAALIDVEENLRGARKIARAGIRTPSAVSEALAPLLPIHQIAALERVDLRSRLRQDPSISAELQDMLDQHTPPEVIANKILEEP